MNSSSSVATGAAAVTGAMLGSVIIWLCGVAKIDAPPADVAMTMGALLIAGAHALVNFVKTRFPAVAAVPTGESK